MRRDLPPRPHIDHLKKQAKDLLESHASADPAALERIRDALPAFAAHSNEQLARAPFALHDAQSAIAREYGFASWRELRDQVVNGSAYAYSEDNLRAVWKQVAPPGAAPVTAEIFEALRDAQSAERRARSAEIRRAKVPDRLPLLATRDVMLMPRSIAPFRLARAISVASVDHALQRAPSLIAVFAQRSAADEDVAFANLYPIGCLTLIHARIPDGQGGVDVVLEALRPIGLESIESRDAVDAACIARVHPFEVNDADAANELAELEGKLRGLASQLIAALPDPERARALLDQFDEASLADIVVANLPYPVSDKAAFAAEPSLVERLRIATHMVERLTTAQPQP